MAYLLIFYLTYLRRDIGFGIIEGNLEAKFPIIWTIGKEEVGRIREERKRNEKIREEKEKEERKYRRVKR